MKNFIYPCFLSTLFLVLSCEHEPESIIDEISSSQAIEEVFTNSKDLLKREFSKAFKTGMMQSEALRQLVKEEALKMFNNDYDVLYAAIKHRKLDNGLTVDEYLRSFMIDTATMDVIESELPTLTIFVPILPEDSFSAALWDTYNEIPEVAIQLSNSNVVPVVRENIIDLIQPGSIPAFPVVVVKENERVVKVHSGLPVSKSSVKGGYFRTASNEEFVFLDDVFNGMNKALNHGDRVPKSDNFDRVTPTLDRTVTDAYNIYNTTDGWQRDYIYYNISPTTTKGEFSYDFQEYITSFSLKGDPDSALNKISDQSEDPKPEEFVVNNSAAWTDGFFEFKVRVLLNAKNGLGSEFITYFPAEPSELFDITYKSYIGDRIKKLESISLKEMNLRLPIFNWDLNQYASSIKIEIEEVDLSVTTTIQETRSVKFANNFSIDPTDGILKKIGLKFGSSLETTTTQTIQKTFTQGNDQLGAVIINFGDDVVVGRSVMTTLYFIRKYSAGWFELSLEPQRVQ